MRKRELILKVPLREGVFVELWIWHDEEKGYDLRQIFSRVNDYLELMHKHMTYDRGGDEEENPQPTP